MATNFPGPYSVEYAYTTSVGGVILPHTLQLNCLALSNPAPGTPVASINLQTVSGSPRALQTCVDDLWAFVRQLYHTSSICLGFTLWKYPTAGSYARQFITAGIPALPAGASAAATTPAWQATGVYRSGGGSVMKLQLMESVHTAKTTVALVPNVAGNADQKLAAFVISANGWLMARDDGFPITPLTLSAGENERLFRERFR